MSPSTTYQKARLSLAMLGLNGLPLDEYLSQLPPLPDTPKGSRRIDDIPEGIVFQSISQYNSPNLSTSESQEELGKGDRGSLRVPVPRNRVKAGNPLAKDPTTMSSSIEEGEDSPIFPDTLQVGQHYEKIACDQSISQSPLARTSTDQPANHQAAPARRLSASFRLPNMGDISLIGECSLFGGAGSVGDDSRDDSLDLELSDLRPKVDTINRSTSNPFMTRQQRNIDPALFQHLGQSTLLPTSPVKQTHLLASTNALHHVEPPWRGNDSTMTTSSDDSSYTTAGSRQTSPTRSSLAKVQSLPRSNALRRFPASKTGRTFPASSSSNSLASVGEEESERPIDLDKSTLLPVSPQKAAYLLRDEEMIARETLDEKPSYMLSIPPVTACRTAARSTGHDDDRTMDVRDLMAKVGKPKRASGTEESFVDLLHAEDDMFAKMDMTILGADETMMMPPVLRPRQTSPSKIADQAQASTKTTLPTSRTSHKLSTLGDNQIHENKHVNLSRSKSLSKVAEIIQRVKADRLGVTSALRPNSPPKTVSVARTYKTSSTSIVTPAAPKVRAKVAPHTTGSRRISLSAGAVSSSASQKGIDLPRPARIRSTCTYSTLPGTNPTSTSSSRRTTSAFTETHTARIVVRDTQATLTARVPRASIVPSSRSEVKNRSGSVSSSISTSATVSCAPNSRPNIAAHRTITRSHTTEGLSTTASVRVPRTSVAASSRPAGLPLPGTGPTARSATANTPASMVTRARLSRAFGSDATSATNRLNQPATSTLATTAIKTSKLSSNPSVTSVRLSATSTDRLKSRALSTPASAATRQSVLPISHALPTPQSAIDTTKKLSKLPPSTIGLPKPRGSTLPRPSVSRVPAGGLGKNSAPPGSGSNIAALRSRLDELQAKQKGRAAARRV
ncbi:hypothetical protein I312_101317 [Cryptococcus bacillisporus CA1280]|uniref:Uncharacterized protein n=1 Tax=Cryptococcus bacillisporus CA1280 TaxID=1296109 RepID=A0A0D0VMQ5_CRYGA|nr:hypothetical protein I312_02421 [Cryptococcus bacillisporus CA1280]